MFPVLFSCFPRQNQEGNQKKNYSMLKNGALKASNLRATLPQVELVGLAGVQGEEEFEFEVVLPEDVKLRR